MIEKKKNHHYASIKPEEIHLEEDTAKLKRM